MRTAGPEGLARVPPGPRHVTSDRPTNGPPGSRVLSRGPAQAPVWGTCSGGAAQTKATRQSRHRLRPTLSPHLCPQPARKARRCHTDHVWALQNKRGQASAHSPWAPSFLHFPLSQRNPFRRSAGTGSSDSLGLLHGGSGTPLGLPGHLCHLPSPQGAHLSQ